jgi:hypothetical protein
MKTKNRNLGALFAPGAIFYSSAVLTAMREAGTNGLSLIYRHIRGDWGEAIDADQRAINEDVVDGGPEEEIVSRYLFPGDVEIVLITSYPHTPSLRWTEICLPEEVIPAEEYQGRNGCQQKEVDNVDL